MPRKGQRARETLEGAQHAAPRLAGALQIGDGRPVGGRLFAALVGEEAAPRHLAAADRDARARLGKSARSGGSPRDARAHAQQSRYHGHRLGARELLAQTLLMAAGQMSRLMRNDADDLVWCLGGRQRAGMDEHAPPGDEGIERIVVNEDDLDARARQPGGLEDRARIVADQGFDLGIAHHRNGTLLRLGWGREQAEAGREAG